MKASLIAAVAGLAGLGGAINLEKKANPAVVAASIERKTLSIAPQERDRRRRFARRQSLSVGLDNEVTLYFANVSLGTPAQDFRLHIDTGSSDLWVNTPDSRICTYRGYGLCQESGTYVANSSSTYAFVSNDFNISYVDGSGAIGDYVTDTLAIGSASIRDFQFGVGYTSSSAQGVLGVGYAVNEVQVNRAGDRAYPNLPEALVNAGLAASKAYSLWLNDLDANTGTILFGGVDTDKYRGSLQTLPIIPYGSTYIEFLIALTDVSSGSTSLMSGDAIPVLLDSGSSLTYLPNNIVDNLYNQYNVQSSQDGEPGSISCDAMSQDGSITYSFSGVQIEVPLNELVLLARSGGGLPDECVFGIAPAPDETYVLGDTFLRSAYVVYDLGNNGISLAQTVFNATSSNVQEITSSGVPDAKGVSGAVTTVPGLPTGDVYFGGSDGGGTDGTGDGESAGAPLPSASMVAIAAAFVTLGATWQNLRFRRVW